MVPQLGDVLVFDLKIILLETVVAVNHPTVVVVDDRAVWLFDPEINVRAQAGRRSETCPLDAGGGGQWLDLDGGWKCC